MKRLLFVCMGNICRSPTAEGAMRRLVAERGLDGRIEVDSAGTTRYHLGDPPDARMRGAAARRGIDLDGRARQVAAADFATFDLIVAMDRDNLDDLRALAGEAGDGPGGGGASGGRRAELRLFSDFLPAGAPADVPDPYFGGERGFEEVLDLVEQGCRAIADHLLAAAEGPG